MTVRPSNIQINLSIRPVWSEPSLCAQWVAKDPSFLHEDSEDSDQTGRIPRPIWVFAGRTCNFVGFVMRRLTFISLFLVNFSFVYREPVVNQKLHQTTGVVHRINKVITEDIVRTMQFVEVECLAVKANILSKLWFERKTM